MSKDLAKNREINALSPRANLTKNIVCYALSFIIPSFLMFLVLRNFGFYPFGDTSLLHSDMNSQYIHFFEYYRNNILLGDGGIFFSWSKEMGTAFMGLFAYYLASPFNLILIFFPDMLIGIFALQVFKAGLCGLAFYALIRYAFREKNVGISGLIFSTSYALMSYAIAFSMCIMWIDGLIFLPLIVLGAIKILEDKRPYLFVGAVALMMISNFYIGFMAIVMSVIFVIFYWVSQADENRIKIRRLLWRFSLFGAIGMSFALWVILPAMAALNHGRVDDGFNLFHGSTNFGLLQYQQSFMHGNFTSIALDGLPHLYVGMTIFACIGAFFVTQKIRLREKLAAGSVLIFLLLSFYITTLDYMWHGFVPYFWFRHRQAFVASFFMIYVAARFFYAVKDDVRDKIKSFLEKRGYEKIKNTTMIVTTALSVIALIFVGSDLYHNALGIKEGVNSQMGYRPAQEYLQARERGEEILEIINAHGDGFYRVRFGAGLREPHFNEPLGFGYKGFGHYSSSYNESLNNALSGMGFAQGWFWSSPMGATSITDAIFGVRFIASRTPLPAGYEQIGQVDGFYIYENLNVLPPVVLMEDDVLREPQSPFGWQRDMAHNILGCCRTIFHDGATMHYIYLFNPPRGALEVDGRRVHYFTGANETHHTVFLGESKNIGDLTITLNGVPIDDSGYGFVTMSILPHGLGRAREYALQNVEYGANYIRGTISSPEERYAFASIPFDEGLRIRVNGERVQAERFGGTFTRFPVPAGYSTIEIRFAAPGLNIAIIGGVLGVLVLGWFVFLDLQKNMIRR